MIEETKKTEITEETGVTDVDLSDLDFDTTSLSEDPIKTKLTDIKSSYVNKYHKTGERDDLGVVFGRFQPPHLGHLFQILAALEVADHVAIVIGSTNKDINNPSYEHYDLSRDVNNPFPAGEREFILRYLLGKVGKERGESLIDRVSFVPLDDVWNDAKKKWYDEEIWKKNAITEVGKLGKGRIDVVVANDGWVKDIFQKGTRVLAVDLLKMEDGRRYEGGVIREQLRKPRDGKPSVLALSGRHRFRR